MIKLRPDHAGKWRETQALTRDRRIRAVCVALTPTALLLRQKGTRTVVSLPYGAAYQYAARLEADRRIEQRRRRRSVARGCV